MMDIENRYAVEYQVIADGADESKFTTTANSSKLPIAINVIGIGGSCLMVVLMGVAILSSPTVQRASGTETTNLAGMIAARFPSGGALKTGTMNSMAAPVLPGSGLFKKIALSALEANNLQRDVKVRHGDEWADVPADIRAKEAQRVLGGLLEENPPAQPGKAELSQAVEAVKIKAKDMAGVTAPLGFFDPIGFSTDCSAGKLLFYREVELKHGRVAMLAALGFLVAEQFHPLFGGNVDVPSYIAFQQTPLQKFWPAVAIAIAIPEIFSIGTFQEPDSTNDKFWTMELDRQPGDFGFDPLGLKPQDPKEFKTMQTKELNNGRLAMIAAAGMVAQELATGHKLF